MSVPIVGMGYLGDFNVGATVLIPFNAYTHDDPSITATITNFANTDVHIHKGNSLTQRNNASGVTIDIDVDAITGGHWVEIDTSDNTVADFFDSGNDYFVRLEGITVDGGTVNPIIGHFSLDNRAVAGLMISTAIATLASQVSFTLDAGSADNDAYNNCIAIVTDQTTRVQKCVGRVSDYTGSSLTVTLAADPGIFTMAAGDSIQIIATSVLANVAAVAGTAQTAGDIMNEIGTAGAGLTDLGGLSTAAKADVNAEVVDVLFTDTDAEPVQGTPGATISLADKIGFLYKGWRNKMTQTETTRSLLNDDAVTVDHKWTVSDDGTTATKGEVITGP